MILPVQVIRAIESLAENGTACIDGTDRELFARVAARAPVENADAHEFELPPRPEEEIADAARANMVWDPSRQSYVEVSHA